MSAQFCTKQDRSLFLELFSTCREGLLACILPHIPTGMHRDTCNLPKTASGAVRNGRRGRAMPSLTRVQSYQVSRAGLVMVIRVSHRAAITRQAHSDGASQRWAENSVCGSEEMVQGWTQASLHDSSGKHPANTKLETTAGLTGRGHVGRSLCWGFS